MNDAITIGMAATAVGTVLWFLVKMMIDDGEELIKILYEDTEVTYK